MNIAEENALDLSKGFIRELEQIESHYWMKYYRGDSVLRTYSAIIAGGMACAMPEVDILAMNRVIGVGVSTPLDQATLKHIIEFYANAGSARFFIQLPPMSITEEIRSLLVENGFVHYNNWSKLQRIVQLPDVETNPELSIREINQDESDNYGQLIFMSFDWEDSRLASWLSSTVGQEGYKHYIVSWNGKDIAAGALFVGGPMASMAFAGTLAPFRGKGAQTLLLKTRMQDALKAGALFITAETAQHLDFQPVRSYLNLRKAGFELAYQRQNWLFDFNS